MVQTTREPGDVQARSVQRVKQQRAVESGLASKVERTVREVVGPGPRVLHEPSFKGNEWKYLKEWLDSIYVSSMGKFVDRC